MRFHRTGTAFLLLALVTASPTPSAAAAYRGRAVSLAYTGPALGVSTPRLSFLHDQCTKASPAPGCVVARIRPGERFVSVAVRDEAGGGLVGASVWVESSDGHFDILGTVCGDSMEVPLEIPRGYEFVEVHVETGTCSGDVRPSLPTTGSVDLWFSTRRFR